MQENGIQGIETIIDASIRRYDVSHPLVKETLHEFPSLRFLLGKVTPESVGTDKQPDGIDRPIYFLTEGSGMFGLKNPDDAMRWRGIFNHIMGTTRQVYYLVDRLTQLTPEQIRSLGERGFDMSTLSGMNTQTLRDFMFVSHAGRRQSDEYTWHGLRDTVHPTGDSGLNTYQLLKKEGAPQLFLDLMRVEMHADHLAASADRSLFPDLLDNVLTYPDWTFGQKPNTLAERFAGLRQSQRQPPEILDILEQCGTTFETEVKDIVDPNIFDHMTHAGPYDWETKIRQAYCTPSGLPMVSVFPGYITQYPALANA
jgi:hypothetical protein